MTDHKNDDKAPKLADAPPVETPDDDKAPPVETPEPDAEPDGGWIITPAGDRIPRADYRE